MLNRAQPSRPQLDREKDAHKRFVHWLRLKGVLFIAYMGDLPFITGMAFSDRMRIVNFCKGKGYLDKGIMDFIIFLPGKTIGIELKREKGGVISPEQRETIQKFQEVGVECHICRGDAEAMEIVNHNIKRGKVYHG